LPETKKKNLLVIEDLHPELDEYLFGAENEKEMTRKLKNEITIAL
jgi:hypothetical protein